MTCIRCKAETFWQEYCDSCKVILLFRNVVSDYKYMNKKPKKKTVSKYPGYHPREKCFVCKKNDNPVIYGDKIVCIKCKESYYGLKNNVC